MSTATPMPARGKGAGSRRSGAAAVQNFKPTAAATGLSGSSFSSSAQSVCGIHRQRQADPRLLQGRDPGSGADRLSGEKFGGFLARPTIGPISSARISSERWMVWPPSAIPNQTVNSSIRHSGADAPFWLMSEEERCPPIRKGSTTGCIAGNLNLVGTTTQGRDVMARMIYVSHLGPIRSRADIASR